MILIHSALADETRTLVKSMESELLKSVGAKLLPNPVTLHKSSHLLGPKVLQTFRVAMLTINFARNSSRRLLKLDLSDGHGEVAAIKYSHIPPFVLRRRRSGH